MYKMNLYLKLFILLLTFIITCITGNYIVLWFLLACLTFIDLSNGRYKLIVFNLLLVVLFSLSYKKIILLIIYKVLFLISVLLTFICSLKYNDKRFFKLFFNIYDNRSIKRRFYDDNYKIVADNTLEKAKSIYPEAFSLVKKNERDLDRRYLQARIRFYGYNGECAPIKIKWCRSDTLILILSIIVFIILLILR